MLAPRAGRRLHPRRNARAARARGWALALGASLALLVAPASGRAAGADPLVQSPLPAAPAAPHDPYGYDPRARPPAELPPPRHTPPVMGAVGAGILPTSLCGRLGPGEDCFFGLVVDLGLAVWEAPRMATLLLDLSGVFFRDVVETGALGGAGLRLRFDQWSPFVPYGLAVLYGGFGAYDTGGGALRLASRFAVGAEISLRDGLGGGGLGLFLEAGSGGGCCTTLESGTPSLAYSQFFLLAGLSFP